MSEHRPVVRAEVYFLTTEEGGRVQAPIVDGASRYMPHIVVQDRADRSRDAGDSYQGVCFKQAPADFRLGVSGTFLLELMYFPQHRYEDVQAGATFTVREGAKVVAHGVVLDRIDPPKG